MTRKYVVIAWVAFVLPFLLVLILGFIPDPALQSFVSLVFFVFVFPIFIVAVIFTIVYLINRRKV